MKYLVFMFAFLPIAVSAQSLRERVAAGVNISAAEWQTMTRGRTVIYSLFGIEVGREYYSPNSDNVYYNFPDGQCLEGRVSFPEPDFCFDWQGMAQMCFQHKLVDGDIYITGFANGGFVIVSDIVDDPFTCFPGAMSALEPNITLARHP